MKKEMMIPVVIFLAFAVIGFVSAGVGIKWERESFLVNEGEKSCLTYSVYNPWPEDSNVQIELSENLKNLLVSQEAETKLVPAETASSEAIPVKFCFEAPEIYAKDCLVGGMMCKKECAEEQKTYEGKVSIKSVPGSAVITGTGGSATEMSIAAPLRLKIACNAYGRDFSLVYIALGIIALIGIIIILYRKHRKPEQERKKEKLEELKEEMKRLKGKK